MELSVVVPTLNGRDRLQRCLDSLSEHAPDSEVVVVNGPSADGTSGMVRDRSDVDALIEVADRNRNVARNAGIAAATGEWVAVVGHDLAVEPGWVDALKEGFGEGADVVTGPTRQALPVGMTTESQESETVAGRSITHFNGDNVAFTDETIEELDGFDEYLETGGARDGSHRVAGLDREVVWKSEMAVTREFETDGGTDRSTDYRSVAYQYTKSYGLRPSVFRRLLSRAGSDCTQATRAVVSGDLELSAWAGSVRAAVSGLAAGTRDGLRARFADRSTRRNPNGISSRYDRAVEAYDWR